MTDRATILLSGASSGIGLATARNLLQLGYRVIGLSRRGSVDDLSHDSFVPVSVDLGDLDRLEAVLRELLDQYDFDGLVHSAGVGLFGSIEQFSVEQIEHSLRVNLTSAMLLSRALIPGMRKRAAGQLIFLGSESALTAGKKGALYSAAKFGLRGFSQALRADCSADGIRVSLINPGMVRSPFFDELDFRPGTAAENAVEVDDVAQLVGQILQASSDIVIDEINLSPRVKSIEFGRK